MSDADIVWEAYKENIEDWDMARVLSELRMIQSEKDSGWLDTSGYERAKDLLEGRIYQIISNHDDSAAYDRAMKGI